MTLIVKVPETVAFGDIINLLRLCEKVVKLAAVYKFTLIFTESPFKSKGVGKV